MPPTLPRRQAAMVAGLSPRLALAIVLAMLVIAVPLADFWRRHGFELQTALDAREALRPAAHASHTQRSLLAHRPVAAAVLAGRGEVEAERQRRQHAVDMDLASLLATLERGRHDRALGEADLLREGWSALLEGISRRRLTPGASDTAHDLLVEQLFVIFDLMAADPELRGQTGRGLDAATAALALDTLPRFTAMLQATAPPQFGHAGAPALSPTEAARLGALARRVARAAADRLAVLETSDADEPVPDRQWLDALVALRAAAGAVATSSTDRAAQQHAHAAAGVATTAGLAQLDADLASAAATLRRERWLLAAALLVTLLVGGGAAWRVVPRPARAAGAQADEIDEDTALHVVRGPGSDGRTRPLPMDTPTGPGAESEGLAGELMRRLRRGRAEAGFGPDVWTRPGPLR